MNFALFGPPDKTVVHLFVRFLVLSHWGMPSEVAVVGLAGQDVAGDVIVAQARCMQTMIALSSSLRRFDIDSRKN